MLYEAASSSAACNDFRIHGKIADLGYDKLSKATEEMASKTVGRFKPYNKKFVIESVRSSFRGCSIPNYYGCLSI